MNERKRTIEIFLHEAVVSDTHYSAEMIKTQVVNPIKLEKYKIDLSKFGVGDTKDWRDLFWEVEKSECVMGMHQGS